MECKSSRTYCGYFGTEATYGEGIINLQRKILRFTKGFPGVIMTYETSFGSFSFQIDDDLCSESLATSYFDPIYVDCTNLDQGTYDGSKNQSSTPGSRLQYFFSLDAIDPCNSIVPTTSQAISVPTVISMSPSSRPSSSASVKPNLLFTLLMTGTNLFAIYIMFIV